MKHIRIVLIFVFFQMSFSNLMAQCGIKNTAFSSGEALTYNLYFNWKFVWVKAGAATMNITKETYDGKSAYCTSLLLKTNQKADEMFKIRDTLRCYTTLDVAPLYYRKGASEGKHYTIDEVRYSYPGSGCKVKQQRISDSGDKKSAEKSLSECAYDMLSVFLRSRNLDFSSWKEGQTLNFTLVDGKNIRPGQLKYGGIKTIKADNEKKYECLELIYMQNKDGKWKDLACFYVTNDKNHVPIRLDLYLKFGSAKAYLTNMKGINQ